MSAVVAASGASGVVYRWVVNPATNTKWVVGSMGASRALVASKRRFSARQRDDQEGRIARGWFPTTRLDKRKGKAAVKEHFQSSKEMDK